MNRLGKVSLLLSLFCFLTSLGFKIAIPGSIPYLQYGFSFGLFFVVFAVAINLRFFRGLLHSASLFFIFSAMIRLLLIASLLVGLNYVASQTFTAQDITDNKIHSLSKLSQSLIKAIQHPVEFVYFYADGQQVALRLDTVKSEINRYKNLNPLVSFAAYSVYQRPDLVGEFKVGNEESALFLRYKKRIHRIAELNEAGITNALLKATKPAKKIYFLEHAGSRSIDDTSSFGLSGFATQLGRLHFNVDTLENFDALPEDLAILVWVGPQSKADDKVLTQINQYLAAGGSVVFAVDPGEALGLSDFLKDHGINYTGAFVFADRAQVGQSPLLVPTHQGRSDHPIAQSLEEGTNPYLFISSTLTKAEDVSQDLRVSSILEHIPTSVGRADITQASEVVSKGEQFAALISEGGDSKASRLAVVADGDFLTNQFYSKPGNFDFAMSMVTYLSRDEDLMKMRQPLARTTYLLLTQTQLNIYFLFFVIPLAVSFFVIALFFKLRRLF